MPRRERIPRTRCLRTSLGLAAVPHGNSEKDLMQGETEVAGGLVLDPVPRGIGTVANAEDIGGRDHHRRFCRSSCLPPNHQLTNVQDTLRMGPHWPASGYEICT